MNAAIKLLTSLIRKFGGAGAFVAGGRLAFLLLVMVAVRLVPPDDFGLFMVCLASSQILSIVCTMGTGPAAQLIVSESIARNRPAITVGYVLFSVRTTLVLSCLIAAALDAASVYGKGWFPSPSVPDVLWGTAVLIVPMAMSVLREYGARALGSAHLAFAPRDVYWTLLLCLMLVAVPTARTHFLPAASITLLVVECVFWVWIWVVHLAHRWPRRRNMRPYHRTWTRTSLWMMSNFVAGFSFERIDTLAVGFLATLSAAGVYGVANRIAPLIGLCQRFVVPVALPAIARRYSLGDQAGVRSEIKHGLLISLMMAGPLLIGVELFAPFIMRLFGERFVDGATTLRILAFAQFALAMQGTLGAALTAAASPSIYSRYAWVALTGTCVALAVLVPRYGTVAAAACAACGIGCLCIAMAVTVYRRFFARDGAVAVPA